MDGGLLRPTGDMVHVPRRQDTQLARPTQRNDSADQARHAPALVTRSGKRDDIVDYSRGADVAAFRRLADAMIAKGRG